MTDKTKRSKKSSRKAAGSRQQKSRKKTSKTKVAKKTAKFSWLRPLLLKALLFFTVIVCFYVLYLDSYIRYEFEGKRWTLPAHVYARPLELYPGLTLTVDQLEQELKLLGYRASLSGGRAGSYLRKDNELRIITREFVFWDGKEEQTFVRVRFEKEQISSITDLRTKAGRSLIRLDPYRYATIFPSHNEDRLLLKREELPELFVKGLVAVEDRSFYKHSGIDYRGLARALWVNITALEVVQGGSTLTQQLVKNYFLTSEQTLVRKAKEAVMASLLEIHYEKDEILEAYCNEVYLGQDGRRAIHGFSLGAQFYFGAELDALPVADLALLIGMVKGPSYYDPRRHPERAIKRRNQVLDLMADQGVIDAGHAQRAKRAPLGVTPKGGGASRFPAFVELVREQLSRDYREEDLQSEGLQVFTTLDPLVQMAAEEAVDRQLALIEKEKGLEQLQSAAVVTYPGSGEVLALIGAREAAAAGFNRAMQARRQVGSLIKPVVYLTALERHSYTLTSPLSDEPLSLPIGRDGQTWQPKNFDNEFVGQIPLYKALIASRNIPTVRLGLDIGVKEVIHTLKKLGAREELPPYPSLFLGAVELSPLEVAQVYQSLADGGYFTPLRAIRSVVTQDRSTLQRYPLQIEQVADSQAVYLTNFALQHVVKNGTAKSLNRMVSPRYNVAGKTGTSNDGRDSWFAGFTGNRLAVVWVGRDDNQATSLTGAQGAMRVWGDTMASSGIEPLLMSQPGDVEMLWVNDETNHRVRADCETAVELPFIIGTGPQDTASCTGQVSTDSWFKELFQ